jgi:hypothetical protein
MNQQKTQHPGRKTPDDRAPKPAQTKPLTKQERTKPQWPIWLGIVAGVVLPSILVVGLFKGNINPSPISRVMPVEAEASMPDAPLSPTPTSTAPETTTPIEKMNLMPAENITPNFVDHVGTENGVQIMYFRDGSRRNLDDFTFQQLPEGTRASITYSRGSNANP